MNHILDYFKKYSAITENGVAQKKAAHAVLMAHDLGLNEDAVMVKGHTAKIFCTTAIAAYIRTHEQQLIAELRAKNVLISRIATVIIA